MLRHSIEIVRVYGEVMRGRIIRCLASRSAFSPRRCVGRLLGVYREAVDQRFAERHYCLTCPGPLHIAVATHFGVKFKLKLLITETEYTEEANLGYKEQKKGYRFITGNL